MKLFSELESLRLDKSKVIECNVVSKNSQSKKQRRNQKIFDRDGNKCLKCGSENNLTIDHIIPLSKKGNNAVKNKQTLCLKCNNEKGKKVIDYRKNSNERK